MFVDASAMVAMLVHEEDATAILLRLHRATTRVTSALAIWEAAVAVSRILKQPVKVAEAEIRTLMSILRIETVSLRPELASVAIDAFERYGKGRHPARLNFGDCFAYACARDLNLPLLFKGQDFSQTDIAVA